MLSNLFKIKRKKSLGATLTELMVSTAIFGFITLGLLGMVQYGTKSWRKVDARFEVEKGLRRAVLDLNYNLRNTDITTFNCGNKADQGISWMAFKVPVKYDASGIIYPEQIDFTPEEATPIKWNFFLLYYTLPPSNCAECNRLFGNFDVAKCPHKRLIKRWIFIEKATSLMPATMKAFKIANLVADDKEREYLEIKDPVSVKNPVAAFLTAEDLSMGDKILAKDIVNFNINYNDSFKDAPRPPGSTAKPGTVQYTLRAFKVLEASAAHVTTDSFAKKDFSDRFTVQIDQGITPMNSRLK